MGYIGQMPQAPTALPGREVSSGDKPEHTGARADTLPDLLAAGATSITLSPAAAAPAAPSADADEATAVADD